MCLLFSFYTSVPFPFLTQLVFYLMDIKENVVLTEDQKNSLIVTTSLREYIYHMRLKPKSSHNEIHILI